MLKLVLILSALSGCTLAQGLGPGPQPGEGQQHPERNQAKRNLNLPYPFYPVYIPYQQVVEVHHVVMLQSPTCVPGTVPGTAPGTVPGSVPRVPGFPFQPPVTQPPPTQTDLFNRIGPNGTEPAGPRKPSRCVWAIVACCSPDSTTIRYSCFELLGCPGVFWDKNPCTPEVSRAAANTALNFYMNGGEEEPLPGSNNL